MNKLTPFTIYRFTIYRVVYLFLDEVLHGLDVVVGHLLNILHALSVLLSKVAVDVAEGFKQVMVEILQLGQRQFTQRYEVLYLHTNTIANQSILRKYPANSFVFSL